MADDVADTATVLRQAQKMQALGQLTSGVAHDFNNILTVISGAIDLIQEGVANRPDLAELAQLIAAAADHGRDLTHQLLSFARAPPPAPRAIDVNMVVGEAARLLRPTLGDPIDIQCRLTDAPWPALADPSQLSNALINLAINARDAMPSGGRLTFETANVVLGEEGAPLHGEMTPGRYVMVTVSDTGVGIPAALRERVCDPFVTTKPAGMGTGLGLSMVYDFVQQSGGHMEIDSAEGYGTTIRIYLPHADASDTTEHPLALDSNAMAAAK